MIGKTTGYTACDLVGLHLPHATVCQIDFQAHVRWKSERANYRYTEDSLESLLSVSKNVAALYFPEKLPQILGTKELGSTSRNLSFSFTYSVVEKNK